MWRASVLTIFPEMFPGTLGMSLAGKALAAGTTGRSTSSTSARTPPTSTAPSTTRRRAAAPAW